MTEEKKTENIAARVTEDDKQWFNKQAERLGIGEGALLRMLIRGVRKVGEGNSIVGLAKLQKAHEKGVLVYPQDEEGMHFAEESGKKPTDGDNQEDKEEASGLDTFRSS